MNNRKRLLRLFLVISFCIGTTWLSAQTVNKDFKEQSLKTVLKEVERQTGLSVIYKTDELNEDKKITANFVNAPVNEVLKLILDDNLEFQLQNKMIVISRRSALQQSGPAKTIKGIVLDDRGEPVIGATIQVKGTNHGTITDMDGNYVLEIPSDQKDPVIVYSYIGYTTQNVPVKPGANFNVKLKEDSKVIDEVVVIGYGTAKRRDLTGAVASVRTEKLEAEAPRDISDLMRGTAAGLNVGVSSSAKGDQIPSIRGVNTLTAGSTPTIVLDGVIYYGELSDINANDVESIDVLKDASSAAVYGSQAANGVIVISTKKGKGKSDGAATITFNANIGIVQSANQMRVLDGKGYLQYRKDYQMINNSEAYLSKYPEIFTNPFELDGTGVNQLDWYNYNQTKPVTSVSEEDLKRTWLSRLQLYTPEIENYLAGIETYWPDLVLQNGFQQDYTISISNRTNKVNYHWSLGYVDRDGIVVGDNFKNVRTRLNLDSKITDYLTVGMNTNFAIRDESSQPVDWGYMARNSPYGSNNLEDSESSYRYYIAGDPMTINPLYPREYRDKLKMFYSLNSNLFAKVSLPFNIEYQLNFTPYLQWQNEYFHQSADSEVETQGGSSYRTHDVIYHWTIDNIIRWKKEFNRDHNIELTMLANAEKKQTWTTNASNYGYNPSDILGYHNLSAGLNPKTSSLDTYWTGDALMMRAFYSFMNKYMITASVRQDGYSAFGVNNKRAAFPSLALGYVLTSEKYMEKVSTWLNYGKIRFSWGQNGNRDIGQYAALSNMKTDYLTYINNGGSVYTSTYMYISTMANNNLRWERTESFNLGLDFSLLNEIFSGSIEVYSGTTKDLLVERSLPDITGFSNVTANLGRLRNKGFELSLNANIIQGKDFNWTSSATLSMNRRKIVSLYGDMENIYNTEGDIIGVKESDDPTNGWFIGQDPDRIWAYERDGVWQFEQLKEAAIYGCKPGDFKYLDQNEDGVLTTDDKVFQGYKTPRIRWSLRNDFTIYNNFVFSFALYSHLGHYGSFDQAANYNSGMPYRFSSYDIPYWTKENPTNDYARISSYNAGTNWVSKSFIRLDNLSFSYNIPKSFLNKFSVQNMRLTLTARNLAVWSPNWTFWDPENASLSPRSFNLGINFTL